MTYKQTEYGQLLGKLMEEFNRVREVAPEPVRWDEPVETPSLDKTKRLLIKTIPDKLDKCVC
jgi:hypothetical protein